MAGEGLSLEKWLRVHRKGLRLTVTGMAVIALGIAMILLGARAAAIWTAQRFVASGNPVGDTIVEADSIKGAFWLLLAAFFLAIVRWLITDRRLERNSPGLTIVRGRLSTEELLRERSDGDAGVARFLAEQTSSRVALSRSMIDQLLVETMPPSPPKQTRWWGLFQQEAEKSSVAKSLDVAVLAIQGVVAPASVFSRVSERRALEDERATVTVTRTIQGAPELSGLLLVPVLRTLKGRLIGSLVVTIDGKAGRTIPMSSARGMVVRVFRAMVAELCAAEGIDRRSLLLQMADEVTDAVMSDEPTAQDLRHRWLQQLEECVRAGSSDRARDSRMDGLVSWLRALIDLATTTDIVFAIVAGGCKNTVKVAVEYSEPYRVRANGIFARARRLIGLGLEEFKIDLHRAAEADVYHLDIRGADGTYVEQAEVVLTKKPEAARPPFVRSEMLHVAPLRGDASTHIYWRDFGGWAGRRSDGPVLGTPQLHIRLRERPPGLLGPAFALSLWICVIAWTAGYLHPVLFSGGGGGFNAWSTLILAVPALLTGWLLSRLNTDTLRVMSLSTFALIGWLSLNVVALVTVVALTLSGVGLGVWVPLAGLTLNHPEWAFLLFSIGAQFCASTILFIGRGLRYTRTINERVDQ